MKPLKIILTGCGSEKAPSRRPACELYTGPLAKARANYALDQQALAALSLGWNVTPGHEERQMEYQITVWRILSALHGVIHPGDSLDPYDCPADRGWVQTKSIRWGLVVVDVCLTLAGGNPSTATVELHAGKNYAMACVPLLRAAGFDTVLWTAGIGGIGKQLKAYAEQHEADQDRLDKLQEVIDQAKAAAELDAAIQRTTATGRTFRRRLLKLPGWRPPR